MNQDLVQGGSGPPAMHAGIMNADLVQGSDEWKAARVGSLGASCVHEVLAKTKSGPSAMRANRLAKLLLERLTGQAQEIFVTKSMQQGTEREPEARLVYSFITGVEAVEVGLYTHPTLKGTHASPDGLVGDFGMLEIKCPEQAAHLETLIQQTIPNQYVLQMQWQMRCAGRMWCDYVSYNPDFPESMRIWIKRMGYDPMRVAEMEKEISAFLIELDDKIARLNSLYSDKAA